MGLGFPKAALLSGLQAGLAYGITPKGAWGSLSGCPGLADPRACRSPGPSQARPLPPIFLELFLALVCSKGMGFLGVCVYNTSIF
jgi:hypothetical protein